MEFVAGFFSLAKRDSTRRDKLARPTDALIVVPGHGHLRYWKTLPVRIITIDSIDNHTRLFLSANQRG